MITQSARAPFHIVCATEHDLLEIVEIEEACSLSPWHWDGYHKELTRQENAYLLVARLFVPSEVRPQIGGFITSRLVADEVHIHNFGVRPTQRRLGIGGALLQHALDFGAQRGALTSFLEVRAGNTAAQALYRQHGFNIVGRRKNYYDRPAEDAVMMLATF